MDLATPVRQDCPHCGEGITADPKRGEAVCTGCGTVVDDETVDHGPEWTAYSAAEYQEIARTGSPTSPTMHDKGLSTIIGSSNTDAAGRQLSARKRSQMSRLRRWNERCRTRDAKERNLKQAFAEINRMASALGLPKSVRETASVIYRRAVNDGILIGRSIEGVASAAIYAAARKEHIPRTLDEVTSVSRVERTRIARAYRTIATELGLQIEPADPTAYLPRFCSALECPQSVQRQAHDLLETVAGTTFTSGKHPAGLAAAALYASACLTGERITQQEISNVSDITSMTIRTHYRELMAQANGTDCVD
ncbi:transcription initiation factor IIB [Halocatena halophila]|uniref:transcription initiation factor IIB n=1 Tax=Halocatena halophila TaxID=2814576 RepID=UPI002ED2A23D